MEIISNNSASNHLRRMPQSPLLQICSYPNTKVDWHRSVIGEVTQLTLWWLRMRVIKKWDGGYRPSSSSNTRYLHLSSASTLYEVAVIQQMSNVHWMDVQHPGCQVTPQKSGSHNGPWMTWFSVTIMLSTSHGFDKDRWVRIEETLAHGNFRPSPLRGWRVPVTDQFFRTSGYALHITSRHLKPKIIQSTFFCTTVYEKDYSSIFHFIGKYLALAIWHPFLCPPLRAPPQKSKLFT